MSGRAYGLLKHCVRNWQGSHDLFVPECWYSGGSNLTGALHAFRVGYEDVCVCVCVCVCAP